MSEYYGNGRCCGGKCAHQVSISGNVDDEEFKLDIRADFKCLKSI